MNDAKMEEVGQTKDALDKSKNARTKDFLQKVL